MVGLAVTPSYLCVHRALPDTASSEIVIFPGGVRCGWVWRELLDQVLTEAYAGFWVCFEVASSALASQKASSPLGLGFMMWFPSFCLRRSALLLQGQKAHWLLIICCDGVICALPVFRMGHACVTNVGVPWGSAQCSLVWNQRSRPFYHIAQESADSCDVNGQPLAFLLHQMWLKIFLWASWHEARLNQVPSCTYYLPFQ